MLKQRWIKPLLIITFLASYKQIHSLEDLKLAVGKMVVKKNIQHDPLFRFYTGKTALVNLCDAHSASKEKDFPRAIGNVVLATIAGVTFATYPPDGKWDSYTFLLSDNETNALKIATVITVINALTNGFFKQDKNKNFLKNSASYETLAGICCCTGPFVITVRPAAIKISWDLAVGIGSYLVN